MKRVGSVAALAAIVIGAFVAGRMLSPEPASSPPGVAHVDRSTTNVTAPGPRGLSAEAIRAAVRAELDRTGPPPAPAAEAPEPAPIEDDERSAVAFAEARTVVDRAIDSGRWTPDNARALRAVIADLGPEEMDQIMTALIAPVNDGRLQVETAGSLLDITQETSR